MANKYYKYHSKHTCKLSCKIKCWRLEDLGALQIMGEATSLTIDNCDIRHVGRQQ